MKISCKSKKSLSFCSTRLASLCQRPLIWRRRSTVLFCWLTLPPSLFPQAPSLEGAVDQKISTVYIYIYCFKRYNSLGRPPSQPFPRVPSLAREGGRVDAFLSTPHSQPLPHATFFYRSSFYFCTLCEILPPQKSNITIYLLLRNVYFGGPDSVPFCSFAGRSNAIANFRRNVTNKSNIQAKRMFR